MSELDDRLRTHYAQAHLPADSVQDLLAMHATAADHVATGAGRRWRGHGWLRRCWQGLRRAGNGRGRDGARSSPGRRPVAPLRIGACIVGLLGIAVVLYHTGYQSGERLGSHAELGTRTLREVAMNHLARLDPDFQGESLAALDERMDRLPFSLSAPERLGSAVRVEGSRYCSLAGHLAAHVTLHDTDSGRPISLFVTALAPDVQRLDGLHEDVAGLDVELWQEEGLFYAMASHE